MDFFPSRYSNLLLQTGQFLSDFTLILDNELFSRLRYIKSFSGEFFVRILIASFTWIEEIEFVMVFRTPDVSQVSVVIDFFNRHFRHGFPSILKTKPGFSLGNHPIQITFPVLYATNTSIFVIFVLESILKNG